ncbi:MAG: DegT/DnrJ/EryC1/StrS family aminotransferase [Patescibacteria group bacterium]|jgi:dTDP-4-amino-4,6-dideoxygalactose transaminase
MANWKVPYVNYKIQSKLYGDDILKEIKRVMDGGDYILRGDVEKFEHDFAEMIGSKYAVGVNSCTDALRLSFRLVHLQKDDEVIVPAHTFLASLDAIVDAGGKPVLVDVGRDHNLDVTKIEKAITNKTVAILPVHLNGRCCNMDKVMELAEKYKLYVIEDAAQALCATYKGKCAGTWGSTGCFSFFPAKLLGTIGDAGIVVTDNENYYNKLKAMRDYGRVKGEEQVVLYGQNSRLDNVHAAILNYKMQYVEGWIARRREIAELYSNGLNKLPVATLPSPPETSGYYDVFQNYPIMVEDRDELVKFLEHKKIEILIHWKTPFVKQKALRLGKYKTPMAETIAERVLSLPMYPELTDSQVKYVCDSIKEFFR